MDRNLRKRLVRSLPVLALVALILTIGPTAPGQDAAALPLAPNCFADMCTNNSPCNAGNLTLSSLTTVRVDDHCDALGDTGIYWFEAAFSTAVASRYDPTVWVATDGGNAVTGQCYRDYLRPPLTLAATYNPPWGPYLDAEDAVGSGDECGDITANQPVKVLMGPVTIQCNANNLDGNINVAVAWDINVTNNCPANNGCPTIGTMCLKASVPYEVNINAVDLAVVKTSSPAQIPSSGQFNYIVTVSNQVYNSTCHASTGYKIVDNLPIWLKVNGALPAGCTSAPDPAEVCYNNPAYPNGCEGYGDIVTCTNTADLLCTDPARTVTLPVIIWQGTPTVPATDPRATNPPPATISNQACVIGFEHDPVDPNNCDPDSANTPTAVEVSSFTATGGMRSVRLEWETGSETENLGFNLYRAVGANGPKVKINAELIPSKAAGSPFGAEYTYEDSTAIRRWSWDRVRGLVTGRTYYYWLEDVDRNGNTGLTGPVEASAGLPYLFGPFIPKRGPVVRQSAN